MADQNDIIKLGADLGNLPAQASKLESILNEVGSGLKGFIDVTGNVDQVSKRLELTFTGITSAFQEFKQELSIGPRGGQIEGLKELTEGSKDLLSGFVPLINIVKQFQGQLNELITAVKQSAQVQITAAGQIDAAEERLNTGRQKRKPLSQRKDDAADIGRQLRTQFAAPEGSSALDSSRVELFITRIQEAALAGTIATEKLANTFTILKSTGELSFQGLNSKAISLTRSLLLADENLSKLAKRDKLAPLEERIATASIFARELQDQFSKPLATVGLPTNQIDALIAKLAILARETGISEQKLVGLLNIIKTGSFATAAPSLSKDENRLVNLIQRTKEANEAIVANAQVTADKEVAIAEKKLAKMLVQLDKINAANTKQSSEDLIKRETEAKRLSDSINAGGLLRQQFTAPAGTPALDAARLEPPIIKFQELIRGGTTNVDELLNSLNVLSTTGVINFGNLDSASAALLRRIIDINTQLKNRTQLSPLPGRVAVAQDVATDFKAAFSQPIAAIGGSTTAVDKLITSLGQAVIKADVTKQRLGELFNAAFNPGTILPGLTTAEQQIINFTQRIAAAHDKIIGKNAEEVAAQQTYNANIAAAKPILDAFIAQLIALNGQLKPQQFASVQAAINRLFETIGKGTLDISKLQAAAGGIGGGGGKGVGLTFLPPDQGGREQAALSQLRNLFTQTGDEGDKSGKKIFLSFQNAFRILEVQTLHTIFGQFIADLRASVDAAKQFQIRISEIRTLSQENQLSTAQWSKGLRELSDSFGLPILDVTKAAYDAISNQVTKGAQTFDFLRTVLQFSLVTVSSATDAQNLLSSAIQAFGQKNITATKAAESLFKLIDLGRVTASEISNIFGRVAQLAGEAGLNIDELGAALATLTIQGVKPNEAFTLLNNLLLKLIKPSAEMSELLLKMGFSSGEAALKTLGLAGVFRLLNKELESGGLSRIADLETNIRAIRAAVAISSGDPLAGFEKNLQDFKNQSEQFANAVKIVGESAGRELTVQLNQIKNIFTLDFGQDFIASILRLSEPFGGLTNIVKTFITLLKDLLTTVNALVSPLVNLSVAILNLFPGGTLESLKTIIEGFTAFYVSQKLTIPVIAALNAALLLQEKAFIDVAVTAFSSAAATNTDTTAKIANTAASRLRAAALQAEVIAAKELALVSGAITLGLTALVFTYLKLTENSSEAAQATEKHTKKLQDQREEINKLRIQRQQQSGVDDFNARNDAAFKNAGNLIAEATRRAVALLDNLHQINTVGLKGLEESLRIVFKEFDKKLTPFEQLKKLLDDIDKSQKRVNNIISQEQTKGFEQSIAGLLDTKQTDKVINQVQFLRQQIIKILNDPINARIISSESTEEIRKTFDDISKILDKFVNQLGNASKAQQKLIADLKVKGETKAFEDSLFGKGSEEQQKLTIQRVNQLRTQAFDLFRQGDLEEARKKFDEIDKLLDNISKGEKEFLNKAGKAGFNFGQPLATDDLSRRNAADRLNLEIERGKQLQLQEGQLAELEKHNLQEKLAQEAQLKAQALARIAEAKKAQEDLNRLRKDENALLEARRNLESANADAQKRRAEGQSESNAASKTIKDDLETRFGAVTKDLKLGSPQAAFDIKSLQDKLKTLQDNFNQQNLDAFANQLLKVKNSFTELNKSKNSGIFGQSTKEEEEGQKRIEDFYTSQLLKLNELVAAKQKQLQAEKDIATTQAEQRRVLNELGKLPKAPQVPGQELPQLINDFGNKLADQLNTLSLAIKDLSSVIKGQQVPRFALGGPVGTDDTLGWFNRRETVVNARSSQQFAPQLRAINMGFEPRFSGSSDQHNINVGDIHVNVQGSQSPNLVAREVGEQIRREIRRGTFRGFN